MTRPENALLRSLSPTDLARLEPHLELVNLRLGDSLYEMEDPLRWVYFPEVGLLSIISVMASGDAIESAMVGCEGGVGVVEALGSETMHSRVIVQVPGRAFRVAPGAYRQAFRTSGDLRKAVHRRAELVIAESRLAIACRSLHRVDKRFSRWLLECQDLSGGLTRLPLKQEFLAVMLGVQRTTVTKIANGFKNAGLIDYHWGKVDILDREGLERSACECRATLQGLRRDVAPTSVVTEQPAALIRGGG